MKVIDLLNKIAKEEVELGTNFKLHYEFYDVILTFMKRYGALGLFFEEGKNSDGEIRWIGLLERYNYQILNCEIEIIEEEKEIEKLDLDNDELLKNVIITAQDYVIESKINQIIDEINKLKSGKND